MEIEHEHEIDTTDLLFDRNVALEMREQYGPATEIKKHVKTSAKVYEIRTALRYYEDGHQSCRTCDATWYRVKSVHEDGLDPDEAMQV